MKPIDRITFEMACSDCELRTVHRTGPLAARSALAHETETGHRSLIATWNGWHRPGKYPAAV